MAGLDCEQNGIVVVDCDKADGIDGEANFRSICEELGIDVDQVPRVSTPRGGVHFYFARNRGNPLRNSAGLIAPGVDVRADGGFVIAPGSLRADGRQYSPIAPPTLEEFVTLLGNGLLPAMPPALEMFIRDKRVQEMRLTNGAASPQPLQALGLPRAHLPWTLSGATAAIEAAPQGERNETLNKHAFTAGLRVAEGTLNEVRNLRSIDAGWPFGRLARSRSPDDRDERNSTRQTYRAS